MRVTSKCFLFYDVDPWCQFDVTGNGIEVGPTLIKHILSFCTQQLIGSWQNGIWHESTQEAGMSIPLCTKKVWLLAIQCLQNVYKDQIVDVSIHHTHTVVNAFQKCMWKKKKKWVIYASFSECGMPAMFSSWLVNIHNHLVELMWKKQYFVAENSLSGCYCSLFWLLWK